MKESDWEAMKLRLGEIAENACYIQRGEVDIWYDNAGHYCDVIWLTASTFFTKTEHSEVLALIDDDNNLYGFKIDAVEWMGDRNGGYTTVNLISKLGAAGSQSPSLDGRNVSDGPEDHGSPVEKGIINARYDHNDHSFDVFWAGGDARYVATENDHIEALIDPDGLLCGFRIININRMSDDEHGFASVRLNTRTAVKSA